MTNLQFILYTIYQSSYLVSFRGDSRAAYEILRYKSPSCKYFCRVCQILRLQLHIDEPGTEYIFRNKEDLEKQVKIVLENPIRSKFYGINIVIFLFY